MKSGFAASAEATGEVWERADWLRLAVFCTASNGVEPSILTAKL